MARTKKMQFNVTTQEYETLKKVAERKNLSMAEVLRDYIKSLDTED
jgi:protein-arginine kinase activator protein McsA